MTRRREIRINGERLRELRLERGHTLRELSDHTGISVPFLSNLELGQRQTTTLASAARLAAALGVATEEVAA
jgi:XRE family transcriptional regulator, regulator of sulfur utilization